MKKINCILLIDDSDSDNTYHKIIIKKANVCNEVKVVSDGLQALEYIANSTKPGLEKEYPKPELIFLDINMPRMNGFEFLEKYHELDASMKSSILIAMLGVSLTPDDEKRVLASNEMNEFTNKSLSVEALHEIMNKYF